MFNVDPHYSLRSSEDDRERGEDEKEEQLLITNIFDDCMFDFLS